MDLSVLSRKSRKKSASIVTSICIRWSAVACAGLFVGVYDVFVLVDMDLVSTVCICVCVCVCVCVCKCITDVHRPGPPLLPRLPSRYAKATSLCESMS
jgi:hypothetical protein